MAVAFSSATRADLLPLSALDFASGVFGINPIVPPKADDEEVTLEQEILLHGQFFDQLLTMVPAQYYLKDEDAAEEHWKSKFWKNKKGAAPKQAIKEKSKAARKAHSVGDTLAFGAVSSVPKGMAGIKARDMSAAKRTKRASLSRLLEDAEGRRAKLESLKGTAEGVEVKAAHDWDAAMRRAGGEKVRDDPKLLKRTIKREARQKKKSGKTWQDRKRQETTEKAEKQAKREENLANRRKGAPSKADAKKKAAAAKGPGTRKERAATGKGDGRGGFEGANRQKLN